MKTVEKREGFRAFSMRVHLSSKQLLIDCIGREDAVVHALVKSHGIHVNSQQGAVQESQ